MSARNLAAVPETPALPDPKVSMVITEVDSDIVDQISVYQDPPRRYARRQHIVLTIKQAKLLRAELDAKIVDAERRNALAAQRSR